MAKLDPVKISWIVHQKEKGTCNQVIAHSMNVSVRWIQKLYSRYRSTGIIPVLQHPGRPKRQITEQETSLVSSAFEKYRCCAVFLEKTIRINTGIHIPHNIIHRILRSKGLASEQPKKSRKRKWVRYERTYSNSMWHTDWKQLDDGRWLVCYEDDASRFIAGHGIFDNATSEHAVEILKEAIKKHGRPASILTDHGSQFYANESEYKTRGATEFEKTLVQLGIKHILARVNHPQTNGKLERFHGEIKRKQKWFGSIDELIHWWNYTKPHMSLDWDNLETPAKAFVRKMPEPGTTVIDEQSGEVYHAE
jgi:putative transposase